MKSNLAAQAADLALCISWTPQNRVSVARLSRDLTTGYPNLGRDARGIALRHGAGQCWRGSKQRRRTMSRHEGLMRGRVAAPSERNWHVPSCVWQATPHHFVTTEVSWLQDESYTWPKGSATMSYDIVTTRASMNRLQQMLSRSIISVCLALAALNCHSAGPEGPVERDSTESRVLALFAARDWASLDKLGNGVTRAYEKDANAFARYRTFFQVLPRQAEPNQLESYNQWVQRFPDSYAAVYARARYLGYLAMSARGEDLARNTPPDKMQQMSAYFQRTAEDSNRSLKLSSRPTLSYLQLIRSARYAGSHEEVRRYYLASTQADPDVLVLAEEFLIACQPRWGGSFEELERLSEEARRKGLAAEKAAELKHRALLFASQDHRLQGDERAADATLAMLIGGNPPEDIKADAYLELVYSAAKREDVAAILDYGRRLADAPATSAEHLVRVANVLKQRNRLSDAEQFFKLAVARDPGNVRALSSLGGLARDAGKPNEALEYFDRALAADPYDKWVRAARGWLKFMVLHDPQGGFADSLAAANQGEPAAQNLVGYLYWSGQGVAKDPAEAVYWWNLGAEKRNNTAIENLAMAKRNLPADYERMLSAARGRPRK